MSSEWGHGDGIILLGNFSIQRSIIRELLRSDSAKIGRGVLQENFSVGQASKLVVKSKVNKVFQLGEVLGMEELSFGVVV